jgi:hypothetical protein
VSSAVEKDDSLALTTAVGLVVRSVDWRVEQLVESSVASTVAL